MAVKWAVANGNWSDGTTWNDGVAPVDGDYVYCNGYAIQMNTNASLPNSVISNGICPNTGVGGGVIQATLSTNATRTISFAEYRANGTIIIRMSGQPNATLIINGNIYVDGGVGVECNTGNYGIFCVINGNIYSNVDVITGAGSNYSLGLTIVGNITNTRDDDGSVAIFGVDRALSVTMSGGFNGFVGIKRTGTVHSLSYVGNRVYPTTTITTANITGDVELKNNVSITTANITGDIIANGYALTGTTLNINGSITYKSTNNTLGVRYTTLNILNPDTFTWKDVTEPRSNPFIILTDAEMNNHQQYPSENEVKQGVEYVWGEKVGIYTPDYPPESVVLKDYEYGDSDDRKTGTMVQEVNVEVGCVTPEDVRKDVPLVGMGVVGSLVVPSVDDVREGVVFDNGSVGTLIVQGGGDRLRIADFGYYTNAQSDTYIVDLTEQDKPKFAVAEERVLIEMFPDLDLDNIPDKYFDDLFVKYLKYRLIVEYYRTAGINSTFTPSEPTTEIVNYQNVRNEVWLNSANIYLKAWAKKFPESITKPQRILL